MDTLPTTSPTSPTSPPAPATLEQNAAASSGSSSSLSSLSSLVQPAAGTAAELTRQDADLYARFFKVLGDPTRIRLLHLLLEAPPSGRAVSELVELLGQPQARVSTHLGCLRWCGLVESERLGKQVFYRLADARVGAILALGGAVMRDHAAEVASCSVIG